MAKILVVEDDMAINKALMIRLRHSGYEVVTAYDGIMGMAAAVKEHPDLAILDISMPGGNGLDLAQRMQNFAATSPMPFIVITASKRPDLRQRAKELGAAAFIEKPYNAVQLLEAIKVALGTPSGTTGT